MTTLAVLSPCKTYGRKHEAAVGPQSLENHERENDDAVNP